MSFKKQLNVIKENWLVLLIIFFLVILLSNGSGIFLNSIVSSKYSSDLGVVDSFYASYTKSSYDSIRPQINEGFAPDIGERKIIQTSSIDLEISRGDFHSAEENLKEIVALSGAYLIGESVNSYGEGLNSGLSGYYEVRVNSDSYFSVVEQLKEIGEVLNINNNLEDITSSYENTKIELEVEISRLERYNELYDSASSVQEKLDINDRIFDQERRIKYLQESIDNKDDKVDYSTIYLSMVEKPSNYANLVLVGVGELLRGMVDSFNLLIGLILRVVPWAVVYLIGRFIYLKFFKKNKMK